MSSQLKIVLLITAIFFEALTIFGIYKDAKKGFTNYVEIVVAVLFGGLFLYALIA